MPVAAPTDKRFRRMHVHPAGKRSWLPPWRTVAPVLLILALVAYGLYRAAERVVAADALTVARITVDGTNRMSPGEVLALVDGLRGANMVTTDLEPWRQKLLAAPWIEEAAIRRVFPGTVSVVISEREPLAIGRIRDALYLIDRRGVVIDEFGPSYADFDLPIVDGLAAPPGDDGGLIDGRRAALAGRLLAELQRRPDLAARISQIDVSDARDAAVILKDDTVLLRVGDGRFIERLQAYLDLGDRLREQVPDIDYVDLRFDDRVYVRPRKVAR
jgi:cell division protein FtsQ